VGGTLLSYGLGGFDLTWVGARVERGRERDCGFGGFAHLLGLTTELFFYGFVFFGGQVVS